MNKIWRLPYVAPISKQNSQLSAAHTNIFGTYFYKVNGAACAKLQANKHACKQVERNSALHTCTQTEAQLCAYCKSYCKTYCQKAQLCAICKVYKQALVTQPTFLPLPPTIQSILSKNDSLNSIKRNQNTTN